MTISFWMSCVLKTLGANDAVVDAEDVFGVEEKKENEFYMSTDIIAFTPYTSKSKPSYCFFPICFVSRIP